LVFDVLRGAQDRGVACAAAQVTGKRGVMVSVAVEMRCGHRHDKARRAKAALAAVVGDHRGLHRMWLAIGAHQPFDRAHSFAVQLRQEQDASVERAAALGICHHHATSPAIAFVAALFRAFQPCGFPQVIQQGMGGVCRGCGNGGSVQ
jgi:hypothetical protein